MKVKNVNKNTILIVSVILIILAGGGGFFGGMQYQKSQRGTLAGGQFTRGTGAGRFGGGAGGANGANRPVLGQIVSSDDKSITVKMSDGSTKIVILSSSTSINKADKGSAADLKIGETVAAFGIANSDGSITAQSVQLNPMMRMGGTSR